PAERRLPGRGAEEPLALTVGSGSGGPAGAAFLTGAGGSSAGGHSPARAGLPPGPPLFPPAPGQPVPPAWGGGPAEGPGPGPAARGRAPARPAAARRRRRPARGPAGDLGTGTTWRQGRAARAPRRAGR